MKKGKQNKRPVGRPITGINTVKVTLSMPADISNGLAEYAEKNQTTKSAVVVELLQGILK